MTKTEIQELQQMSSEIKDIEAILQFTGDDSNSQFKIRCRRKCKEGSMESGTYTVSPSLSRFIFASLRTKGEELKAKLAKLKIISEDGVNQSDENSITQPEPTMA